MEDSSQRKHITGFRVPLVFVRFYLQDLGGHVTWSSATSVKELLAVDVLGQSHVDNHHFRFVVVFLPDHYVLQLQIPMHDALLVEVVQPQKQLVDDFFSFAFGGNPCSLNVSEQGKPQQLHRHIG